MAKHNGSDGTPCVCCGMDGDCECGGVKATEQPCRDTKPSAGAGSSEVRCCACNDSDYDYVCDTCGCHYCRGCYHGTNNDTTSGNNSGINNDTTNGTSSGTNNDTNNGSNSGTNNE